MNPGRAARDVGGWLLTAVGVVVILLVTTGDHRFSRGAGAVVAVAVGLSALAPVLAGIAYLAVRRRNRATEAAVDGTSVSPRARAVQTSLASVLDRVAESTDGALGMSRVVLGDRLELTATTLRDIDDPWEALRVMWFVRPSQVADYPQSQHLRNLPAWAQDTVVLLDLRRELQLRGVGSALSDEPGFYRHGFARVCEAATHTGSAELVDVLLGARREASADVRTAHRERQRLLELLDDVAVWTGLLDGRP
ncbi:hypothetical protein [Aeromicrobium fastidiosum]|uniref:Uncharacterized protein n=1 Tax=Aeromicrobium fastidiosum TaxID=52699 RepID=A0A641AKM3_9ACTN|nr:hypothetical protein [Aeromicrobium fastidiosum]KAA1373707.1 hypothetical protein ESP62_017280 [Aeromicrobium fastidiosum]MBP2391268.1 hypothetical protein [Aeromicrobium fastidiosum]